MLANHCYAPTLQLWEPRRPLIKTKGFVLVFFTETLRMEMFSMRKDALKILMAILPAFLWIAAAPPKAGAG
jgi:hypothetical protein